MDKFPTRRHVTLTVDGQDFVGWLNAGIERSIETIAARFSVDVGLLPDGSAPPIDRQDDVVIKIGSTVVITGIVLSAEPYYNGHDDYGIRVQGRDRTGDLIIAAAIHEGGQWRNATVLQIAQDLCTPYEISVTTTNGVDIGKPLERFELSNGESVASAISRACKYRGILLTRDNNGNLNLTTAGSTRAPGALVLGDNVISMSANGTDGDRCSEYIIQGQGEINQHGSGKKARDLEYRAKDTEIMRYLPCIINADDGGDKEHMQKLAEHTARVRAGRAYSFTFRVDGWEVLGIPWEPNQMVPIRDPVLGYEWEDLLIVSTNATVDRNNADVTDIVVAPKEGYEQLPLPEPENDSGGAKRGRKKRSCKYGLGSDGNCKRKGRRKS
jgi:prophage tail gpP-like protein